MKKSSAYKLRKLSIAFLSLLMFLSYIMQSFPAFALENDSSEDEQPSLGLSEVIMSLPLGKGLEKHYTTNGFIESSIPYAGTRFHEINETDNTIVINHVVYMLDGTHWATKKDVKETDEDFFAGRFVINFAAEDSAFYKSIESICLGGSYAEAMSDERVMEPYKAFPDGENDDLYGSLWSTPILGSPIHHWGGDDHEDFIVIKLKEGTNVEEIKEQITNDRVNYEAFWVTGYHTFSNQPVTTYPPNKIAIETLSQGCIEFNKTSTLDSVESSFVGAGVTGSAILTQDENGVFNKIKTVHRMRPASTFAGSYDLQRSVIYVEELIPQAMLAFIDLDSVVVYASDNIGNPSKRSGAKGTRFSMPFNSEGFGTTAWNQALSLLDSPDSRDKEVYTSASQSKEQMDNVRAQLDGDLFWGALHTRRFYTIEYTLKTSLDSVDSIKVFREAIDQAGGFVTFESRFVKDKVDKKSDNWGGIATSSFFDDGQELIIEKSQHYPALKVTDSDNDGLFDWMEYVIQTDANNPDTDGDGVNDAEEFLVDSTSPKEASDYIPGKAVLGSEVYLDTSADNDLRVQVPWNWSYKTIDDQESGNLQPRNNDAGQLLVALMEKEVAEVGSAGSENGTSPQYLGKNQLAVAYIPFEDLTKGKEVSLKLSKTEASKLDPAKEYVIVTFSPNAKNPVEGAIVKIGRAVNFNALEGTFSDTEPGILNDNQHLALRIAEQEANYTVELPEKPENEGYQFVGWITAGQLEGEDALIAYEQLDELTDKSQWKNVDDGTKVYKFTERSPVDKSREVYAVYRKNDAVFIFHSNNDQDSTVRLTAENLKAGENFNTRPLDQTEGFIKENYQLVGWAEGDIYDPGQDGEAPASNDANFPKIVEYNSDLSQTAVKEYFYDGGILPVDDKYIGKITHFYAVWKPRTQVTVTKKWGSPDDKREVRIALMYRTAVGPLDKEIIHNPLASYTPIGNTIANFEWEGEAVKTLSKDSEQTASWDNLPAYDKHGKRLSYIAVELSNKAYEQTYKQLQEGTFPDSLDPWTALGISLTETTFKPDGSGVDVPGHKEQNIKFAQDNQVDLFSSATKRTYTPEEGDEFKNFYDSYNIEMTNMAIEVEPPIISTVYANDNSVELQVTVDPAVKNVLFTYKPVSGAPAGEVQTVFCISDEENLKSSNDAFSIEKIEDKNSENTHYYKIIYKTGWNTDKPIKVDDEFTAITLKNVNPDENLEINPNNIEEFVVAGQILKSTPDKVTAKQQPASGIPQEAKQEHHSITEGEQPRVVVSAIPGTDVLGNPSGDQLPPGTKFELRKQEGETPELSSDSKVGDVIIDTDGKIRYVFPKDSQPQHNDKYYFVQTSPREKPSISLNVITIDLQAPKITAEDIVIKVGDTLPAQLSKPESKVISTDEGADLKIIRDGESDSRYPSGLYELIGETIETLDNIAYIQNILIAGTAEEITEKINYKVSAEDKFGNKSEKTFAITVQDLDPSPAPKFQNQLYNTKESHRVEITGKQGATIKVTYKNADGLEVALPPITVPGDNPDQDGTIIVQIPKDNPPQQGEITAVQTLEGMKESEPVTKTLDIEGPATPSGEPLILGHKVLALHNIATDVNELVFTVPGSEPIIVKNIQVGSDGSFTFDEVPPNFNPGNDSITIIAKDKFGNESQPGTIDIKEGVLINPGTSNPTDGYIRISFTPTEDGSLTMPKLEEDGTTTPQNLGNAKIFDLHKSLSWREAQTQIHNKGEIPPKEAYYKDNTQKFTGWDPAIPQNEVLDLAVGKLLSEDTQRDITFTAQYEAKAVLKEVDADSQVEAGYVRIILDAQAGLVNNKAKLTYDVLEGTHWDNEALSELKTLQAVPTDVTQKFVTWSPEIPATGEVTEQTFTAQYEAKAVLKEADADSQVEAGYVRIILDAQAGLVNNKAKLTYDVLEGTHWDNEALSELKTLQAVPTDVTQKFVKWSPEIPATGEVTEQTFMAQYEAKAVLKEADADSEVEAGYVRIILDAQAGLVNNKAKLTYDVLKGTHWDNDALSELKTLQAVPTDVTQKFVKWSPEIPATGEVTEQTFTAQYEALEPFVEVNPDTPDDNPDENNYVKVTFSGDESVSVEEISYWVLKGTAQADLLKAAPEVKVQAGYKEPVKWTAEPEITEDGIQAPTTLKASAEELETADDYFIIGRTQADVDSGMLVNPHSSTLSNEVDKLTLDVADLSDGQNVVKVFATYAGQDTYEWRVDVPDFSSPENNSYSLDAGGYVRLAKGDNFTQEEILNKVYLMKDGKRLASYDPNSAEYEWTLDDATVLDKLNTDKQAQTEIYAQHAITVTVKAKEAALDTQAVAPIVAESLQVTSTAVRASTGEQNPYNLYLGAVDAADANYVKDAFQTYLADYIAGMGLGEEINTEFTVIDVQITEDELAKEYSFIVRFADDSSMTVNFSLEILYVDESTESNQSLEELTRRQVELSEQIASLKEQQAEASDAPLSSLSLDELQARQAQLEQSIQAKKEALAEAYQALEPEQEGQTDTGVSPLPENSVADTQMDTELSQSSNTASEATEELLDSVEGENGAEDEQEVTSEDNSQAHPDTPGIAPDILIDGEENADMGGGDLSLNPTEKIAKLEQDLKSLEDELELIKTEIHKRQNTEMPEMSNALAELESVLAEVNKEIAVRKAQVAESQEQDVETAEFELQLQGAQAEGVSESIAGALEISPLTTPESVGEAPKDFPVEGLTIKVPILTILPPAPQPEPQPEPEAIPSDLPQVDPEIIGQLIPEHNIVPSKLSPEKAPNADKGVDGAVAEQKAENQAPVYQQPSRDQLTQLPATGQAGVYGEVIALLSAALALILVRKKFQ